MVLNKVLFVNNHLHGCFIKMGGDLDGICVDISGQEHDWGCSSHKYWLFSWLFFLIIQLLLHTSSTTVQIRNCLVRELFRWLKQVLMQQVFYQLFLYNNIFVQPNIKSELILLRHIFQTTNIELHFNNFTTFHNITTIVGLTELFIR